MGDERYNEITAMDTSHVEMALSAKGVEMLHIDGYLYHFADIGRYGYRWMCNKRKDKKFPCKARLVTTLIDDDLTKHQVIIVAESHTHERCTDSEIYKVLQRRIIANNKGEGSTLPRSEAYYMRLHRNRNDHNDSSSKHAIEKRKFKQNMVYLLKTSYGSQMVAVNGFLYRLEGRVKSSGSLRWECIRSRDIQCQMHIYTNPTESGRYKLQIANGERHNHEPYTPQKLGELLKKHNVNVISESKQTMNIKQDPEKAQETQAMEMTKMKRLNATRIYELSNNPLSALAPKDQNPTAKRKFTFLPSAKGNQVLCLENNIYHFDSIGPQTQRSYWTCILRRDKIYKCNGRVTTQMTSNGPIIVKVSGVHMHPDNTEEIKRRLRKNMMIPGEDEEIMYEEIGSNDELQEADGILPQEWEEVGEQDQPSYIVKKEFDEDQGSTFEQFLQIGDDPNELDFEVLSEDGNQSVEIIESKEDEIFDITNLDSSTLSNAIEINETNCEMQELSDVCEDSNNQVNKFENKNALYELMQIVKEDMDDQEEEEEEKEETEIPTADYTDQVDYPSNFDEMIEEYLDFEDIEQNEEIDEANLFAEVDPYANSSDAPTTSTITTTSPSSIQPIVLEEDVPDMDIKKISMLRSAKGGELLCVDGYIYHFKCVKVNRVYWACIKCKDPIFKCSSRVITKIRPQGSFEVVRVTNRHSHPVSHDDIHRRLFNAQKNKSRDILKPSKRLKLTPSKVITVSHSDEFELEQKPYFLKHDDDDGLTMKLYAVSDGPPSLAVRMTLKALDISYELINVDYCTGEHLTEEYAQMNPQKEIPVLDDNGFFLSESIAIMQYLCEKYAPTSPLYPLDPTTRALVNHRLCFNMSFYYSSISAYAMAPIFFDYPRNEMGLKKVNNSLSVFETYLKREGTKYAAADYLTIADFALVASTLCLEAIGFDLSPFPLVKKWYETFKKEYPQYWEIANGGMQEIAHFEKNPPDLSKLNHPFHPAKKLKT